MQHCIQQYEPVPVPIPICNQFVTFPEASHRKNSLESIYLAVTVMLHIVVIEVENALFADLLLDTSSPT